VTHPTEVKPREGEQRGTFPDEFELNATLPELRFTVTPDIVSEYLTAIDATPEVYTIDGRQAAPPNVLAVYLLAVLYRRFPPVQGIILAKQSWRFHQPIWANEVTEMIADGVVESVEQRRGKHFVRWSARFMRSDGSLVATADNEFYVPTEEESLA
jgi:hypothetical protein